MSMPDRVPGGGDLPPDLLELVAERLQTVSVSDHAQVLTDLAQEHPGHEGALRRLAEDLAGAERLLDVTFATPAGPIASIGPYRVLRLIGEGAFGAVHLCAQEFPVRREVAVKVLRPGVGDRQTLARFESERHVLATLNHPAIAQVFDAGALPDGRPYFVMEYVHGLPITSYCDQQCLGVDARVALFARLCQGAHHAHVQGIVHRDFKPANVLVFEQDGQAQPKIIDFGIAKALHPTDGDRAIHTETGRVLGTPGYMSPEQATGRPDEVDARTDVFALGVMLYELLTGELPWGRRPATTDSEPPRPSVRVTTDPTGDVARQRATPPRKLASRLRGDLDWIVLKALARERERRYASALELAEDLGRHLRGVPVLAGPPSLGYRLRKLGRRHRGAAWATGAALLAIALGVWFSLSFRTEAMTRAADLEVAARNLLARANDKSVVGAPQSEGLRKALVEDALAFYDSFLRERPAEPRLREGRARALWTLSQVHWLVGEYERSEGYAREATAEAEALVAADPDNLTYRGVLGNALRNVGRALSSAGRVEAGRSFFDRAVEELERCHARAPAKYSTLLVAALMEWSGSRPQTELDDCADGLRRAVAIQEQTVQTEATSSAKVDLLDALGALVHILMIKGDLDEAAVVFARANEVLAVAPDARPGHACRLLGAGATLARRRGNDDVEHELLTRAIAAATRWSEQEPAWPQPWNDLQDLQGALALHYQAARAERAAGEARRAAIAVGETRTAKFPDDHLARGQLADMLSSFAGALLTSGRRRDLAEAETYARRAVALLDTLPDSVDAGMRAYGRWLFLSRLGFVLDAGGNADAREVWQHASVAMEDWRNQFGVNGDIAAFADATLRLARHHLAADLDDRAGACLEQVETVLGAQSSRLDALGRQAAEAHRLRAHLAARRGDDDGAAAESARASAIGAGWHSALAAADGMRAAWQAASAALPAQPLRVTDLRDRAIVLYQAAVDALQEQVAAAPDDLWVAVPWGLARVRLAALLQDRGDRERTRALLADALPALAAARDEAHADCWDEALYREGQAIASR